MNTVAFISFIFISLFGLLIPIIIGVYVYTDAKKRGMNAALWTLVAIFAPALVGLIIYLIVRVDNAQCPSCKTPVSESFAVCPKCGATLKSRCPGCGFRAEPDWKVCPQCAAELPVEGRVDTPVYKKDKGIGKLLLAVILIPILLLVLLVAGLLTFRASGSSGTVSMTGTTSDVLKEDFTGNATVQSWLSECDKLSDGVYAINYPGSEDGLMEYLIYLKGYTMTGLNTGPRSGRIFGKPYVNADILAQTEEGQYDMFFVESRGFPPSELQITLNGKRLDIETTDAASSVRPVTSREAEKAAAAAAGLG